MTLPHKKSWKIQKWIFSFFHAQSLASSDSGTDRVISRCRKAERTRLVREHFLSRGRCFIMPLLKIIFIENNSLQILPLDGGGLVGVTEHMFTISRNSEPRTQWAASNSKVSAARRRGRVTACLSLCAFALPLPRAAGRWSALLRLLWFVLR